MDLQRLAAPPASPISTPSTSWNWPSRPPNSNGPGATSSTWGLASRTSPPPAPVVHAAEAAMRRGVTQYTGALGIHALREAIAGYYKTAYGIDIPERRVIGDRRGFRRAAAGLRGAGGNWRRGPDARPELPLQPPLRGRLRRSGAHWCRAAPAERFQLTAAQVAANWGPEDTRGVLLASPSNPTGTSILPDELRGILARSPPAQASSPFSTRSTRACRTTPRRSPRCRWTRT